MYYISYTIFDDIEFEWDIEKEKENIIKHGIDFTVAVHVFLDNNRIEFYDNRHSESKDRYYTIGLVNRHIMVVYTIRKRKN